MSLGLDGLGAGVEWNGVGWRGITWSGEEERDVPTTNPSLPQDFPFVDFALVGKSRYTHIYVYNIYIYMY